MLKRNAIQLRRGEPPTPEELASIKKQPVYIILDNVLDTYNVGAIFRLADAVSASRLYLCGETMTPPDHKIKKASVNTWQWVEWQYVSDAKTAIANLRSQIPNVQVVAVELDERSVSYDEFAYKAPVALVVGHESEGVSQEVLDACDAIVELPMYGVNVSLNVMVSLGIVLYQVMTQMKKS